MQSAQQWALTQLTYVFPGKYRELYLEAKADKTGDKENSKAQGVAKRNLSKIHRTKYLELYELGVSKGFPRRHC